MNIFLRSFNSYINSKTGAPLPPGQRRGTPEWEMFEKILITSLTNLGHQVYNQPETPLEEDRTEWLKIADRKIAVHKCKRDLPSYNLFYMQMHMRNLFTIDQNGWGNDHSQNSSFNPALIDVKTAREFCLNLSDQMLSSGISKCDQPEPAAISTPEKFILVPLQIPRDYVLKHHSKITVYQFVEAIIDWAKESKSTVCFKLHPHNKADLELIKAVDSGTKKSTHIHKVEGNINELIKRSCGLFVINSGTGFEGMLHGKPVATFGDCDYKTVTFNGEITNLDFAKNFLFNYSEDLQNLAYQFVYWYHVNHAYDVYNEAHSTQRLTEFLQHIL
jgi:Capsule polysaccharide biosynthesis protein